MNTSMKWKNCLGTLGLHYKWVLLFLYLNFFFSLFFFLEIMCKNVQIHGLQDDNEGPVTKSIRLTSSLILRNLVIYSTNGRR